jgi:hypothetical protein
MLDMPSTDSNRYGDEYADRKDLHKMSDQNNKSRIYRSETNQSRLGK